MEFQRRTLLKHSNTKQKKIHNFRRRLLLNGMRYILFFCSILNSHFVATVSRAFFSQLFSFIVFHVYYLCSIKCVTFHLFCFPHPHTFISVFRSMTMNICVVFIEFCMFWKCPSLTRFQLNLHAMFLLYSNVWCEVELVSILRKFGILKGWNVVTIFLMNDSIRWTWTYIYE